MAEAGKAWGVAASDLTAMEAAELDEALGIAVGAERVEVVVTTGATQRRVGAAWLKKVKEGVRVEATGGDDER